MSSPRVRRLKSDYERVVSRFDNWPLVRVEFAGGSIPPDTYRIRYGIKGLYVGPGDQILEKYEHVLEIKLGLEYPRRAPQLRLLTSIFHPNFNETEVCAQDIYAASEGLDNLIIRVGRMIAYQEYNTKSPLNGIAGKWAAQNSYRLPVDRRDIAPPSVDGRVLDPVEWSSEIKITAGDVIPRAGNHCVVHSNFTCPKCASPLIESKSDDREDILHCPICLTAITSQARPAVWFNDARWLSVGMDDDGSTYYLDQESISFCGGCFDISLRTVPIKNKGDSGIPPDTSYIALTWRIYPQKSLFDMLAFQFYDNGDRLLSSVPCEMLRSITIKKGGIGEKILNYGYNRLVQAGTVFKNSN